MNVFSQIKYNMSTFVQFIEYCHCDSVHHCMSQKHCMSNFNQIDANSLEVIFKRRIKELLLAPFKVLRYCTEDILKV